ncbi:cutinase family protein [Rhodococcoides yunnanense]|uniref:Cutinase family protein n=1 Tax=Rhodococcoides yunnanense TaxID=278209 RepID=A0ABU4B9B4_9NOCA|nr:cutinase family protein [Rhodococcus yunnanensis]MDV6260770.1 cutinase family protein [Rhodococcus yunnanensis]
MKRRWLAYSTAALAISASAVVLPAGVASAAPCSDVDISFARGTGELPGLGITGTPFVNSLKSQLSDRSVSTYAVNYAADFTQASAGPGSRDLVAHLNSVAASCPSTTFVIGGYSQGATVVTNAVGLRTPSSFSGAVIPAAIASRVEAVVVFGNPFGLSGQKIETSSNTYGSRATSFCNFGDPVCQIGGFNAFAHLQYGTNGTTTQGAQFAATKVRT